MSIILYSLLLFLPHLVAFASAAPCNGLNDLCDLKINQATFPGSHNAGSGFDGHLHYLGGGLVFSCWYRNQRKSFIDQLNTGIRYFDIDTCYKGDEAVNCHCGPDNVCAYTGSVMKAMKQIDSWMKPRTTEVVIIHFNHNAQSPWENQIADSLQKTLLSLWNPNGGGSLLMNTYHHRYFVWPTLRTAIAEKQRIFIFMDRKLERFYPHDWLHRSDTLIESSWGTVTFTTRCNGITKYAESKCNSTKVFMELSAVGTKGLCVKDMAYKCSKWLGEAAEACLNKRKSKGGGTVNFLTVDYVEYYHEEESIINKAKYMNKKNIKRYLGRDIFFPELAGCSYHAGWARHYCWTYCPKYGWCWVNLRCGSDNGICKRSEIFCYGSCGYYD